MASPAIVASAGEVALPPIEVQLSTLCWVGAVAAGGVETVLAVSDALAPNSASGPAIVPQVVLRVVVFTLVLALAGRVWNGRNWARWSLAAPMGLLSLLSVISGPISWPASGHSLDELDADAQLAAFAVLRSAHVTCVVVAVVLMFLPAANRYFRGERRTP